MLAWQTTDRNTVNSSREENEPLSLVMDWQSPRNKKWIRVVALAVICAFLNQDIVWAQGGNPVWSKPVTTPATTPSTSNNNTLNGNIAIPRDVAVTKEVYTGSSSPKTIINIQDAHASLSAQESISSILDSLVTNYDLKLIAIEGSSGYIDTSILKTFPDESIRKDTAKAMMAEGKMSAGAFFAITSNKPITLYGIEDKDLYLENIDQFRKVYELNQSTQKDINNLINTLNQLKDKIYSEDLKKLESNSVLHEDGKITFTDRWQYVSNLASKYNLDYSKYPNLSKLVQSLKLEKDINFNTANKERDSLIDELSKKLPKPQLEELVLKSLSFKTNKITQGDYYTYLQDLANKTNIDPTPYKNLINYTKYITIYESVDLLEIFNEVKHYEEAIIEKLYATADQKKLHDISKLINHIKDLFNLKLTNGDFEYLEKHIKDCNVQEINKLIGSHGKDYDLDKIFSNLDIAKSFYRTAEERNQSILSNTIKRMDAEGTEVAALITGGYHTKGISDLLKAKQTSYVVILPKFDASKGQRPYVAILTNKKDDYSGLIESGKYRVMADEYIKNSLNDPAQIEKFVEDIVYTSLNKAVNDGKDVDSLKTLWKNSYRQSFEDLKAKGLIKYTIEFGQKNIIQNNANSNSGLGDKNIANMENLPQGGCAISPASMDVKIDSFEAPSHRESVTQGEEVWRKAIEGRVQAVEDSTAVKSIVDRIADLGGTIADYDRVCRALAIPEQQRESARAAVEKNLEALRELKEQKAKESQTTASTPAVQAGEVTQAPASISVTVAAPEDTTSETPTPDSKFQKFGLGIVGTLIVLRAAGSIFGTGNVSTDHAYQVAQTITIDPNNIILAGIIALSIAGLALITNIVKDLKYKFRNYNLHLKHPAFLMTVSVIGLEVFPFIFTHIAGYTLPLEYFLLLQVLIISVIISSFISYKFFPWDWVIRKSTNYRQLEVVEKLANQSGAIDSAKVISAVDSLTRVILDSKGREKYLRRWAVWALWKLNWRTRGSLLSYKTGDVQKELDSRVNNTEYIRARKEAEAIMKVCGYEPGPPPAIIYLFTLPGFLTMAAIAGLIYVLLSGNAEYLFNSIMGLFAAGMVYVNGKKGQGPEESRDVEPQNGKTVQSIRDELINKIRDEQELIEAFKANLPAAAQINPIPEKFISKCMTAMFTERHILRDSDKLYDELFELWQLYLKARQARTENKDTYCMVINDLNRVLSNTLSCTQIFIATPNRTGIQETIGGMIRQQGLNINNSFTMVLSESDEDAGIAVCLYQLQQSPTTRKSISAHAVKKLFDSFDNKEIYDFDEAKALKKSTVEAAEKMLQGIHSCTSNGVIRGTWDGIPWDYEAATRGEEFNINGVSQSDYSLGGLFGRNMSDESSHLSSVLEPLVTYYRRMEQKARNNRQIGAATMAEGLHIMVKEIFSIVKIQKGSKSAAFQLREYYHKYIIQFTRLGIGKDKGKSIDALFKRIVRMLDKGYSIPAEDVDQEERQFFKCYEAVYNKLPESSGARELMDEILKNTVNSIRKYKYAARFAMWQWLDENYPKDGEGERSSYGKIMEGLINEISLKLDMEEVTFEGLDELINSLEGSGREVVLVSKEPIMDEMIFRTLIDKYGIRTFVYCNGGTKDHLSVIAQGSNALIVVGLPEIVFERLVKSDRKSEGISVYRSDVDDKAHVYLGPTNTDQASLVASKIFKSETLGDYYDKRQRGTAQTIALTNDERQEDRVSIPVYGNIIITRYFKKWGNEPGVEKAINDLYAAGANGIGLGRTEYMYNDPTEPTLKEQFKLYRQICDMADMPVTLRTYDKRDDKECPALPHVPDVYSFDYYHTDKGREALLSQVVAMLGVYASSKYKNLKIMFPMVKTVEDMKFLADILEEAKKIQIAEYKASAEVIKNVPIGIMVEDKEAILNLQALLDNTYLKVSFVSIGTNDLISSVKGIPRKEQTSKHFDKEIMAIVKEIVGECAKRGISVTMCGDAARLDKTLLMSVCEYKAHGLPIIPSVAHTFVPRLKSHIAATNAVNCHQMFDGWPSLSDIDINKVVHEKVNRIIARIETEPLYRQLLRLKMSKGLDHDIGNGAAPGRILSFKKVLNTLGERYLGFGLGWLHNRFTSPFTEELVKVRLPLSVNSPTLGIILGIVYFVLHILNKEAPPETKGRNIFVRLFLTAKSLTVKESIKLLTAPFLAMLAGFYFMYFSGVESPIWASILAHMSINIGVTFVNGLYRLYEVAGKGEIETHRLVEPATILPIDSDKSAADAVSGALKEEIAKEVQRITAEVIREHNRIQQNQYNILGLVIDDIKISSPKPIKGKIAVTVITRLMNISCIDPFLIEISERLQALGYDLPVVQKPYWILGYMHDENFDYLRGNPQLLAAGDDLRKIIEERVPGNKGGRFGRITPLILAAAVILFGPSVASAMGVAAASSDLNINYWPQIEGSIGELLEGLKTAVPALGFILGSIFIHRAHKGNGDEPETFCGIEEKSINISNALSSTMKIRKTVWENLERSPEDIANIRLVIGSSLGELRQDPRFLKKNNRGERIITLGRADRGIVYVRLKDPILVGNRMISVVEIEGAFPLWGKAGSVISQDYAGRETNVIVDTEEATGEPRLSVTDPRKEPFGAKRFTVCENEAAILMDFDLANRLYAQAYVARGVYHGKYFGKKEAIGYLITGLEDFPNEEELSLAPAHKEGSLGIRHSRGAKDTYYEIPRNSISGDVGQILYGILGEKLRAYHDKGYCHGYPSILNDSDSIGLDGVARVNYIPYFRNLSGGFGDGVSSTRMSGDHAHRAAQRFLDIAVIVHEAIENGYSDCAGSFIRGYFDFYEEDPLAKGIFAPEDVMYRNKILSHLQEEDSREKFMEGMNRILFGGAGTSMELTEDSPFFGEIINGLNYIEEWSEQINASGVEKIKVGALIGKIEEIINANRKIVGLCAGNKELEKLSWYATRNIIELISIRGQLKRSHLSIDDGTTLAIGSIKPPQALFVLYQDYEIVRKETASHREQLIANYVKHNGSDSAKNFSDAIDEQLRLIVEFTDIVKPIVRTSTEIPESPAQDNASLVRKILPLILAAAIFFFGPSVASAMGIGATAVSPDANIGAGALGWISMLGTMAGFGMLGIALVRPYYKTRYCITASVTPAELKQMRLIKRWNKPFLGTGGLLVTIYSRAPVKDDVHYLLLKHSSTDQVIGYVLYKHSGTKLTILDLTVSSLYKNLGLEDVMINSLKDLLNSDDRLEELAVSKKTSDEDFEKAAAFLKTHSLIPHVTEENYESGIRNFSYTSTVIPVEPEGKVSFSRIAPLILAAAIILLGPSIASAMGIGATAASPDAQNGGQDPLEWIKAIHAALNSGFKDLLAAVGLSPEYSSAAAAVTMVIVAAVVLRIVVTIIKDIVKVAKSVLKIVVPAAVIFLAIMYWPEIVTFVSKVIDSFTVPGKPVQQPSHGLFGAIFAVGAMLGVIVSNGVHKDGKGDTLIKQAMSIIAANRDKFAASSPGRDTLSKIYDYLNLPSTQLPENTEVKDIHEAVSSLILCALRYFMKGQPEDRILRKRDKILAIIDFNVKVVESKELSEDAILDILGEDAGPGKAPAGKTPTPQGQTSKKPAAKISGPVVNKELIGNLAIHFGTNSSMDDSWKLFSDRLDSIYKIADQEKQLDSMRDLLEELLNAFVSMYYENQTGMADKKQGWDAVAKKAAEALAGALISYVNLRSKDQSMNFAGKMALYNAAGKIRAGMLYEDIRNLKETSVREMLRSTLDGKSGNRLSAMEKRAESGQILGRAQSPKAADAKKPVKDGFISQGTKAQEKFESAEIFNVTDEYREMLMGTDDEAGLTAYFGTIKMLGLVGEDDMWRIINISRLLNEEQYNIYGFDGIIEGPDDFFLGKEDLDFPAASLYLALDLMEELVIRGPPTLVYEYIMHEMLCAIVGHYKAIEIQQKLFPQHYLDGKFVEVNGVKYIQNPDGTPGNIFKGLLGKRVRSFINNRITGGRISELLDETESLIESLDSIIKYSRKAERLFVERMEEQHKLRLLEVEDIDKRKSEFQEMLSRVKTLKKDFAELFETLKKFDGARDLDAQEIRQYLGKFVKANYDLEGIYRDFHSRIWQSFFSKTEIKELKSLAGIGRFMRAISKAYQRTQNLIYIMNSYDRGWPDSPSGGITIRFMTVLLTVGLVPLIMGANTADGTVSNSMFHFAITVILLAAATFAVVMAIKFIVLPLALDLLFWMHRKLFPTATCKVHLWILTQKDKFSPEFLQKILEGLKNEWWIKYLLSIMNSPDEKILVRQKAAYVLGQIGTRQAYDALMSAAKKENFSIGDAAADALVEMGDELAIQPLWDRGYVEQSSKLKKLNMIIKLIVVSEDVPPQAVDVIKRSFTGDLEVIWAGSEALSKIDASTPRYTLTIAEVVLILAEIMKTETDSALRIDAARALNAIYDESHEAQIAILIPEDSVDMGVAIVQALGHDTRIFTSEEPFKAETSRGTPGIVLTEGMRIEDVKSEDFKLYVEAVKAIAKDNNGETLCKFVNFLKKKLQLMDKFDIDQARRAINQLDDRDAFTFAMQRVLTKRVIRQKRLLSQIYNRMELPEGQFNNDVAVGTTDKIAENDMYFFDDVVKASEQGIVSPIIYGDTFKTREEAEAFAKAGLKTTGYSQEVIGRAFSSIVFINKFDDNGARRSYADILAEIKSEVFAKFGTTIPVDNIGIRAIEKELLDDNQVTAAGKLLEIKPVKVNGVETYVSMNTYQVLLRVVTKMKDGMSLDALNIPGLSIDKKNGRIIFTSPIVPYDYNKEIGAYRDAVILLAAAA